LTAASRIEARRRAPAILAISLLAALVLRSAPVRASSYLPVIEPAPSFSLIDSGGRAVSSTQLRGSVLLLDFMYTHCTTVCPMVTERMAVLERRLRETGLLGHGATLVSISFDPARDTPDWLATYAKSVGADRKGWLFLTGSEKDVANLLERYDFHIRRTASGDFDHISRVYLIDPSGNIRNIYSVSFLDPLRVENDVNSLLAEQHGSPGSR
jgi:protein SCO1